VNNIPPNQATARSYSSNKSGRNPSTRNRRKNNCGVEKHRARDDADALPVVILCVGRVACLCDDDRNRIQKGEASASKQKPRQ
jgi:hypothetical protein